MGESSVSTVAAPKDNRKGEAAKPTAAARLYFFPLHGDMKMVRGCFDSSRSIGD
jgi:hypothetical protein